MHRTADLIRPLPAAEQSEAAILGAALNDRACAAEAVERLSEKCFSVYRRPFLALAAVVNRGGTADVRSVWEQMQATESDLSEAAQKTLWELAQWDWQGVHFDYHLERLEDLTALRRVDPLLLEARDRLREAGVQVDEFLEWLGEGLESLRPRRLTGTPVPLRRVAQEMADWIGDETDTAGVATGIPRLEFMTAGWQDTDLIVIAGRPGMGKTAIVLHFTEAAARAGIPVLVFSLEMPRQQLLRRWVAGRLRMNLLDLRAKRFADGDLDRISRALGDLGDWPVDILDRSDVDILTIRSQARRWRKQHPGKVLIVIDYLQRVRWPKAAQNENVAVEQNCIQAKHLARELVCPVLLVSQMSRANQKTADKRPSLETLRGSGGIEQEADLVAFLHREGYYRQMSGEPMSWPQPADFIIAKHRNGPDGTVKLWFDGPTGRFWEVDETRDDAPPERHYKGANE